MSSSSETPTCELCHQPILPLVLQKEEESTKIMAIYDYCASCLSPIRYQQLQEISLQQQHILELPTPPKIKSNENHRKSRNWFIETGITVLDGLDSLFSVQDENAEYKVSELLEIFQCSYGFLLKNIKKLERQGKIVKQRKSKVLVFKRLAAKWNETPQETFNTDDLFVDMDK